MKYKKEIEKNNIDSNLIVEKRNNCKNNNANNDLCLFYWYAL